MIHNKTDFTILATAACSTEDRHTTARSP